MTYYMRVLCPKCSNPIRTKLVAERPIDGGAEEDRVDVCCNPDCDWKSDQYTTSFYARLVEEEEVLNAPTHTWVDSGDYERSP